MSISLIAFAAALPAPAAPAVEVAAAPALAASDSAVSAATGTDAVSEEEQPSIVVTGQRPEYGASRTRAGTRTDTDIRDVPQAITVISESQIEDQGLRSIADVLTYVPGAIPGTGEANRDQISLRGNNTTADFFLDGLRDDAQYFRDLYNLDRVEVLRGPNAMIFGRGGGGGVVNRVTKRSSGNAYREVSAGIDSEGGFRLTGDIDTPLTDGVGVRVNGVYENGESFRRGVELERYGINPTVGARFGDTRIDLSYEYFRDQRTTDRGVPAAPGGTVLNPARPLEGYDTVFFGDPEDSFSDAEVNIASFAIEHRFSDALTLRNRTQYADYDKGYQNVFPGAVSANGLNVALSAYRDTSHRQNLISQTDLILTGDTGGIGHTLLLGFELGRQETLSRRLNGVFQLSGGATSPTISVPLSAPTIDATVDFRPGGNFNDSEATIAAVYIQDQIRISDALQIVAGLRFDRFEIDAVNLNNNAQFSRTDELVSPRLGVIVRPTGDLSLYASYSRSYLPSAGDQFTSLDLTASALEPERFDNYEVGAKWELFDGLLATFAVYRLDRTNTRALAPDGRTIVQTGAQRSRGAEVGLERQVSNRWQISAGYALQDAEITEATASAPAGRNVPFVPRHQFSLWNRYDVSERLGVGLGVVARSSMFASISNAVRLPGYFRADAALFYELAEGIEAQVNVENLFGRDYFSTAHSDNNIAPGAPRTARATVRFTF